MDIVSQAVPPLLLTSNFCGCHRNYEPAAGGFLSRLEGELVLLILKWGEGVHSIPSGSQWDGSSGAS